MIKEMKKLKFKDLMKIKENKAEYEKMLQNMQRDRNIECLSEIYNISMKKAEKLYFSDKNIKRDE